MSKPTDPATSFATALGAIAGMLYLSAWLAFTAYLITSAIRMGLGG